MAGAWGWQALQALASLVSSLAALAWEHRDKAARGARATWRAARRAAASGWDYGVDLLVWLRVWLRRLCKVMHLCAQPPQCIREL